MRKKLFLLILEFIAITAPLAWWWVEWGGAAYLELFRDVAHPLIALVGAEKFPAALVRNRFINWLPFLTLMLITPELGWRRRVVGSLTGLLLIFFCHLGLASMAAWTVANYGISAKAFSTLFPFLLLSDAFPFLLWAVIARDFVREVARRAVLGRSGRAADS